MSFVIPAPVTPSVAIYGSADRFPVRRIFCVGRNYAAHAREMGNDDRDPPFFFTKPADAVVDSGAHVPYPPLTSDLHHEVELVLAIGLGGTDIAEADALDHVWGYGVGCDLTRRDLQGAAKKVGRPWDWGKAFDNSAPCGPLRSGSLPAGAIRFRVNGKMRQEAQLDEMIWSVPEIIAICSQAVRLEPGDLIMTGTPAGVGPLQRGDVCEGEIEGLPPLSFTLA
ncbi:fumarylacetoacetate hydrolase family protein [Pontivivens insulae]|uniref:Fumarylpyruvate hydrolase n=1 Tax=Pontivivens insulae TaxID=1639689 RepID=A0A2R8AAH2_9RHOB|nr:fumarylacetoacetate hydrolase family protein [Pontivivens insulae]RED13119.1 fumarylpyruvate hydrolase [Pontivivens insulae]SPF29211.1 Fumarylpyruvate hydrolase [Pontivivens insulae]